MSDLDRLIAAVEAEKLTTAMCEAFFPERHEHRDEDPAYHMIEAYMHSLDAALRLHEALLPDVEVDHIGQFRSLGRWKIRLGEKNRCFSAKQATPARAWLLAILRALKAKGGA